MRRHNLGLVLASLRESGGASRAELAAHTGLTRATVATLLDPLLTAEVLAEETAPPRGVGRPSRPVRFHPGGPVALGIAIDVDSLAVCATDLAGRVCAHRRVGGDNRGRTAEEVYAAAADLAGEVRRALGRRVLGAGVAVPGLLGDRRPVEDGVSATTADRAEPVVLRAPNLPALTGTRPGSALADRLDVPVVVENEATLGALAHLGLAPDFVSVSGEIGVGGGIVLGGRVYRGANGLAGELGHVVVDRDGPACGCGGRGCVEQYAGKSAVLGDAGVADVEALREALAGGDGRAVAAVGRAGTALGVALASVVNVLDVPVIVLGGIYAELAPDLRPALEAELRARSLQPAGPTVLASELGEDAAVRGAADAVLADVHRDPDRLVPAA
ncbi:MAG: ROK family protein [Pseudonocardia sp.]|nr:ROK family protein [Pseudonocardia sp.]